jgi:hypothetical protein
VDRDVDDVTWQLDLAAAIALHDLATAGHALVPSDQRIETARVGVVAAIDRAEAAGVPVHEIDAVLEGMGKS